MGMDLYFYRSKELKLSVPGWDIVQLNDVEDTSKMDEFLKPFQESGIMPTQEESEKYWESTKTNMVDHRHANALLQEITFLDADHEHHEYFRKLLIPNQSMFDSYTLYKVTHEQMRKYLKVLRQINANHRLARSKLPIPIQYQRRFHEKYDEYYFDRIERLIANLENIDTDCQYYFSASY